MLFRRIYTSVSRSSNNPFSLYRKTTNPFAIFESNSQFLSSNSFRLRLPSSNFVSHRFCSANCNMGDARRPTAVPIPAVDKADRAELYRALEASLGTPFSSQPFVPNPSPLIIVISGPSGVGKDAVIKRLREVRENIHFVVTATSRGMRPGEVDGKDYFFVCKEEFLSMVERQELLEYALVYGDYKGIPKQQIRDYLAEGCDIVLRVDVQGAATLRKILRDSAVFIFLAAESESSLVQRLIDRKTETKETLLVRIATAREEMKHVKRFDYVVVNKEGELENSVKLVESIIDAERAKVQQRKVII